MQKSGQGTIEYLVILAVIIVISLVVVALIVTSSSSQVQQIGDSSNKLNDSSGGISIVESVTDLEGDTLIKLSNISSDAINLNKISVGSTDNNYLTQLVGLDAKVFSVKSASGDCTCSAGQKSVSCTFLIQYTKPPSGTVYSLTKTVVSQCVSNSTSNGSVVNPIDSSAPVVTLISPQGTLDTRIVDFNFVATEENEISFCSINLSNGSSLPVIGVTSGVPNVVRYTFSSDISFDWNVECEDDSGNIGTSDSKNISIVTDSSPPAVSLIYPADKNISSSRDLIFQFSATDESQISSCTLNIGSDSNTYYNLNNGENTIAYTKLGNDGKFDWNVSCSDGSYSSTSDSRIIFMDINALQIASCIELQDMNKNLSGNYELMNDIDCGYDTNNASGRLWNDGNGFKPIGVSGAGYVQFSGSLEGNGFSVYNLKINRPSTTYVGLIGYSYGGKLSNLNLVDGNIIGYSGVGGILGASGTAAEVTNCSFSGRVSSSNGTSGGIAGSLVGVIQNSHATGSILGYSNVGGLIGYLSSPGHISDSYFSGTVYSSYSSAGGLVGYVNTGATVDKSYSIGQVNGGSFRFVGGLVGYLYQGSITNSFSSSDVTAINASFMYAGGLVGNQYGGNITNTYSTGAVSAKSMTGGLVGSASGSSSIYNSYSLNGSVSGTSGVGGIVGSTSGATLLNSFSAASNIIGSSSVGGFLGYNFGSTILTNGYFIDGNNNGFGVKEDNNLVFFVHDGSSHAVYYGSPVWDGNWTFRDNNFPILSWQ